MCGSRSIAGIALVASLLSACAALVRQPQPAQQWSVGQRPGVLPAEDDDASPSMSRVAPVRIAARVAPTPPPAEAPLPPPPPQGAPAVSEAGAGAPLSEAGLASKKRPTTCEAWCDSKYIGAHCQRRKCRGCAFCRSTQPHEQQRPPPGDSAPPAQGDAPPPGEGGKDSEDGGSELQRPQSECLGPAEGGGPPSYDLVALILSSNQPGPEPERRRRAVRSSWAREGLRLGAPGEGAPPCALRFLFVLGGARDSNPNPNP